VGSGWQRTRTWLVSVLSWRIEGSWAEELTLARKDVVLDRVVILVWVAVFMMPFAILSYVATMDSTLLPRAATIVAIGEALVLVVRALVKRGVFDRAPQLAPFVLVGGVFGPVASATCVLTATVGGFFFSYFLIAIAFISLFPVDVRVVLATCFALGASYASAVLFRSPIVFDPIVTTNLLYVVYVAVLAVIFNRVLAAQFFDERRARLDLKKARDALLGEMAVAQEIQSLLLPPRDATLPGHVVRGVMVPADEVGGDYYDVVEMGKRRFVAVGDVSGHGITSGVTMMMARSCLVGALAANHEASLEEIYRSLNLGLRRNLERMQMRLHMTFALVEDLGGGRFRAIGAHLPVLVWRYKTREVEEHELSGVWLGVLDDIPDDVLRVVDIELSAGDLFLLYTDGVIEMFRGDEMFGYDRLRAAMLESAEHGPDHVIAAILRDVRGFGGVHEDDITLLALQYKGEARVANAAA
jgi:phosphoserine phosphatase RsbU/P